MVVSTLSLASAGKGQCRGASQGCKDVVVGNDISGEECYLFRLDGEVRSLDIART